MTIYAIRRVLLNLNDPYTTEDERHTLIHATTAFIQPLQQFLDVPPAPPSYNIPRIYTGRPGRPRLAIDLPRALCLHALGASWERVAQAMGVVRRTIYYHLERAGITTTEAVYSDISDDDLDELVAEISLSHPFDGAGIIRGHLLTRGHRLPMLRVQESLKRVDPIGVLTRYVTSLVFTFLPSCQASCSLAISKAGQASFVVEYTVSAALCRFGIKTATRSFSDGGSTFMDASMDSVASFSTWLCATTRRRQPFFKLSSKTV